MLVAELADAVGPALDRARTDHRVAVLAEGEVGIAAVDVGGRGEHVLRIVPAGHLERRPAALEVDGEVAEGAAVAGDLGRGEVDDDVGAVTELEHPVEIARVHVLEGEALAAQVVLDRLHAAPC